MNKCAQLPDVPQITCSFSASFLSSCIGPLAFSYNTEKLFLELRNVHTFFNKRKSGFWSTYSTMELLSHFSKWKAPFTVYVYNKAEFSKWQNFPQVRFTKGAACCWFWQEWVHRDDFLMADTGSSKSKRNNEEHTEDDKTEFLYSIYPL